MNRGIALLYVINFLMIGALPRVFFRKGGRLNLRWWVTAAPFLACGLFLFAGFLGWTAPMGEGFWPHTRELAAVPLSVLSITLMGMTLGTHRIPIALWHQPDDAPAHLVTYGAYQRIRHPFYASFLLALTGAALFCPHPVTLFSLAAAWVVLNATAAKEEQRLLASAFGVDYAAYLRRTGRFWPRWRKAA